MDSFKIDIPDAALEDLRDRLGKTRFPDQLDGAQWEYGTELEYMKELIAYWLEKFDWRAAEKRLNEFDQYRAEVDGLGLHFIHQRSRHEAALPIVFSHGWPGSIFEFTKIIGPLTDPVAHGGRAEDAFHVVCPSLPGYGFSEIPSAPGTNPKRIAGLFADLMAKLGYARYGAQGGDWGAVISSWLGVVDEARVAGVHLNMLVVPRPRDEEDPTKGLSEKEMKALADLDYFSRFERGYQQIQGTKPQTLGYGLNDSPAGLAAWIVEKFRSWSDCDGDVERRFTKDDLLTNIMIYWVTQTITSSTRLYYESRQMAADRQFLPRVEVPTGCAIFPKEMYRAPRRWAEKQYNVQRWTEMESGGHFAALEEPEALVADIRAFFRDLR